MSKNVVARAQHDNLSHCYFNIHGPSDTPLSRTVHEGRTRFLQAVLKELGKIDPRKATPADVADALNALVTGGTTQVYIAKQLNTSKATVNRWRTKEFPPRPLVREIIIERCKSMLQELIDSAYVTNHPLRKAI